MTVNFRAAKPDQAREIARLQVHSFPATGRTAASQEEFLTNGPHGGIEAVRVGEEGGRLVAACQLLSLKQWIGGVPMPIMGLGSVAIAPTHRRRGVAGRMLAAAFEQARERGDLASALYPFRISYYARMGYALAGEALQYQVPPDAFPDNPQERARVRLVATDEDRRLMYGVYDAGARLQTGQMQRTERSWGEVWSGEGGAAVVYRGTGGNAEGYAIVRYRPDLPLNERYLEVTERMWLTPGARTGIYAWLSSLGDQWTSILYRAHPDEGLADVLREPRLPALSAPGWGLWFGSATLLRGPMFRLLNVPDALKARSVSPESEVTVSIEVADEHIPANRGPWHIRIKEGQIAVGGHNALTVDATVSLSVATLSRIFIGAITPSMAVDAGLATIDNHETLATLDVAFRLPGPWTFDRF
ncbi:MAG TPA: GNAT family N-acetyltransferase [Longimicrobiaceae bacterium]|nr:GNAT family N-acetyltransferase [Longimicrobiaceae bacterium]